MLANRNNTISSDCNHIADKKLHTIRKYPYPYRMVWAAVIFIFLLLVLDLTGYLDHTLQREQNALLEGTTSRTGTFYATVLESKKGQSYCWLQLESGERVYGMLPYEDSAWYPAGTKLCVSGELSLPDGRRNPGGFDQAAWLRTKQTGVILSADVIQVLSQPQGIWRLIQLLYENVEAILYHYLPTEADNLAMALLVGEKHRLDETLYSMAQQMGIAHIFAVSGLHVGVIGSVVLFFFRELGWMRSRLSFILLGIGLLIYCMLVGLPASALRAAGMILLSALAIRLNRPVNSINFLSFAALLLLLDNPFLLWSAGFQLSFGVTLALLVFVRPIEKKLSRISMPWVRSSLAVVLAACLGSVPISAWHFYTISPISPLFNFLLVPLVSMAVPLLLLALLLAFLCPAWATIWFLPAKIVLFILQYGTVYLYEWVQAVLHVVQWNIGRPPIIALLLYIVFVILLWHWLNHRFLFPKKYYRPLCSVLLALIVLISVPTAPKETELLYLDVGQGSCAVLRTKAGEVVLFDTGAQKQEVASVLAWYGVSQIDAVILSHCDTDHINGLRQVMAAIRVEQIISESKQLQRETMKELIAIAEKNKTPCIAVEKQADLLLRQGSIKLAVFSDLANTENSDELTAVLCYGHTVAAFPGDLALNGVEKMIAQHDTITIWTVPHHGSRFSGNAELYQALQQKGVQCAVISAGKDNRYGHPHQQVLFWLDDGQIPYYELSETGAVCMILSEIK